MYYIVYKTTCKVNNKIYIGQHKTENPKIFDGYFGTSKALEFDIKQFGRSSFIRETLFVLESRDEALQKEAEIVDLDFIARDDTYNVQPGGKPYNDIFNYSKAGKLGQIGLQKKLQNEEYKKEWLEKFRVKMNSQEVKKRISRGVLNWLDTHDAVWTGKKHTDESKKKIGKANSKHQQGKNNSNYGNCWIHNLELKESKSISKSDLQKWLKQGWIKGRKIKFI